MIGLGDIVLPALAIAYGRRLDLVAQRERGSQLGGSGEGGGAGAAPCWAGGYFLWAVVGYAVGLLVTEAANAYGWTFNGVHGQPALLYLVPGVIGSQLLRAVLMGELGRVWEGSALPQPPATLSSLGCDGCGRGLLLDELVWTDERRNLDYCQPCYADLPEAKRLALAEQPVYARCGVGRPTGTSDHSLL